MIGFFAYLLSLSVGIAIVICTIGLSDYGNYNDRNDEGDVVDTHHWVDKSGAHVANATKAEVYNSEKSDGNYHSAKEKERKAIFGLALAGPAVSFVLSVFLPSFLSRKYAWGMSFSYFHQFIYILPAAIIAVIASAIGFRLAYGIMNGKRQKEIYYAGKKYKNFDANEYSLFELARIDMIISLICAFTELVFALFAILCLKGGALIFLNLIFLIIYAVSLGLCLIWIIISAIWSRMIKKKVYLGSE